MCDAFAAFFFDQRARGSRRLFVDIDREDLGALSSQENRSRFSVPPARPYRSCAAMNNLHRSFGAAMPSYIGTAYRSTGNLRSFQSTIPPWRL
jgi:hypothetical protein